MPAGACKVGHFYQHDEQGLIKITGGGFWGEYGVSNFFYWEIVATGEQHHGYGGTWSSDEVTDYGRIGLATLQMVASTPQHLTAKDEEALAHLLGWDEGAV